MRKKLISCLLIILMVVLPFSIAKSFSYDANGNIVGSLNGVYGYDAFNNLIQVNNTQGNILEEYTYDDEGNRLTKYENSTDTTTYYLSKNLVRVINSTGTFDTYYYYGDSGTLLSRKDSDGKIFYYHPDHLGSTTLITNESGDGVESTKYEPFGGVVEGGNDRFTFTGQELDLSGLMYYGARYYDTQLRQFIQPDSLLPDMYDPQQLNRYSYVRNNPYRYTDPTGNVIETLLDIGFIIWDIVDIFKNPFDPLNYAALGGDVAGAFVPFFTGGGKLAKAGIKSLSKGNQVVDVGKGVDKGFSSSKTVGKTVKGGDDALQVTSKGTVFDPKANYDFKTTKSKSALQNKDVTRVEVHNQPHTGKRHQTRTDPHGHTTTENINPYTNQNFPFRKKIKGSPAEVVDKANEIVKKNKLQRGIER